MDKKTEAINSIYEKISQVNYEYKNLISNDLIQKAINLINNSENNDIVIENITKSIVDRIEQIDKSPEQLASDHKTALIKAEELYVNEGLLDRNGYMQTVSMINKVFDNYMHGPKRIPVDEFRKLQQTFEYENTTSHNL